jgi:hypothetical protein
VVDGATLRLDSLCSPSRSVQLLGIRVVADQIGDSGAEPVEALLAEERVADAVIENGAGVEAGTPLPLFRSATR